MSDEVLQNNRKKALKTLDKLKQAAYSGLTCEEYDMIKSAYLFIKMRKTLADNEALRRF